MGLLPLLEARDLGDVSAVLGDYALAQHRVLVVLDRSLLAVAEDGERLGRLEEVPFTVFRDR